MTRSSLNLLPIILCFLLSMSGASFAAARQTQPVAKPVTNGARPVVSPDGLHVMFVSYRGGASDLFVISSDGTGEAQLTHTPEYETPAGWTRDSKHVFYSVTKDDRSTLYQIGIDGQGLREMGRFEGRGPQVSSSNKRVVYMAGSWTATRLMVADIGRGGSSKQPQSITDGSSIAWNVQWSPDGNRLAFTGEPATKSELGVFVMRADGSRLEQITHLAQEEGGAQVPAWSRDGKQLAFQVNSRSTKDSAHLWVVDLSKGAARKLGVHDRAYLDETPSWFPDGKRIAFQSNRTGRMEIWIMNTDGSGQTQLTR